VELNWVWKGHARNEQALIEEVEDYEADVYEKILVATRCVLRCFPPHQAAEAETKLNARLAEIARAATFTDTAARWTARAEVSLHDTVRELQQRAWSRRLEWHADHELAKIVVADYEELAHRWRAMLQNIGIGTARADMMKAPPPFLTRHLVRLAAQPQNAADIVDALSAQREEKDQELLQAVMKAISNFDNANLLEFETAHDSALRRLMDWAGLQLPDGNEPPSESVPR
jgi:hypothetical protein